MEHYTYTVCFIRQNEQILLLNRLYPPVMGLWNGVGGTLEEGETPLENIQKEIEEETRLQGLQVEYRGILSWECEGKLGGMHLFTADLLPSLAYPTPCMTEEGILDWKPLNWVLDPLNEGLPLTLKSVLPLLWSFSDVVHVHTIIQNGKEIFFTHEPLNERRE